MINKRVYLATVFSWKTKPGKGRNTSLIAKFMEWLRYRRVTKITAKLLEVFPNYNFFSPITSSYPIAKFISPAKDTHDLWLKVDFDWIDVCDELWVYMQPGWEDSYGVQREIRYATQQGKKIRYISISGFIVDSL